MNVSADATASAIRRHRTRTEKRLIRLLDQAGSSATVDEIKRIIFSEEEDRPFIIYVIQLTELFGDNADHDAVIPAIQDAWNYFPHRRFGGSCPAEQMLRLVPGLTPRDLRA
jgi:hypothetical protein